ncbi:MAG: hypothetical protein VKP62_07405 [Candidatus Sericytochromatia bacterium]|nr:hypothetical protein [Candidatus Sericytochromatia bacterium]
MTRERPGGLRRLFTSYPGEALRGRLRQAYREAIEGGLPSDRILVLTATWGAWRPFLDELSAPTGARRVVTSLAWLQEELRIWWPLVEEALARTGFPAGLAHNRLEPSFVAIDLSQYLLGRFLAAWQEEDGGLIPGARSALTFQRLQVLDVVARAIEHGLPLLGPPEAAPHAPMSGGGLDPDWAARGPSPAETLQPWMAAVAHRLHAGQIEAAAEAAPRVAHLAAIYVDAMLRARIFDHALALAVYTHCLWPAPAYQQHFCRNTSLVLVEDIDESAHRWLDMVVAWSAVGVRCEASAKSDPAAGTAAWTYRGGLREYVGAAPWRAWEVAEEVETIETAEPPLAPLGRAFGAALTGGFQTVHLPSGALALRLDASGTLEMLDRVAADLAQVLMHTPPDQVALVVPALSPMLIFSLRVRLARLGYPLYVFAGTTMLSDHRAPRLLLTLARLAQPDWGPAPSRFEVIELLEAVTGLNPLQLARREAEFYQDGALVPPDGLTAGLSDQALARYASLHRFVDTPLLATDPESVLREAFTQVWAPFLALADPLDEQQAREVSQMGQLIELAARFREIESRLHQSPPDWGARFLTFLRDQPVAERPFFQREPHRGAVMLATASQLSEKGFSEPAERLSHLFLLDFGAESWWKSDRREFTNARLLSLARPPGLYTLDEEHLDASEKLARVLMTCCLKVETCLWVHACLTDEEGREQQGELPNLLVSMLGAQQVLEAGR